MNASPASSGLPAGLSSAFPEPGSYRAGPPPMLIQSIGTLASSISGNRNSSTRIGDQQKQLGENGWKILRVFRSVC